MRNLLRKIDKYYKYALTAACFFITIWCIFYGTIINVALYSFITGNYFTQILGDNLAKKLYNQCDDLIEMNIAMIKINNELLNAQNKDLKNLQKQIQEIEIDFQKDKTKL